MVTDLVNERKLKPSTAGQSLKQAGVHDPELQRFWNWGHQALRGSGVQRQESWLRVCAWSCQTLFSPLCLAPKWLPTFCELFALLNQGHSGLWDTKCSWGKGCALKTGKSEKVSIPNAGLLVTRMLQPPIPLDLGISLHLVSFLGEERPSSNRCESSNETAQQENPTASRSRDSPGALFIITPTWAPARPCIIQLLGKYKWKVYCLPGIDPDSETLFQVSLVRGNYSWGEIPPGVQPFQLTFQWSVPGAPGIWEKPLMCKRFKTKTKQSKN